MANKIIRYYNDHEIPVAAIAEEFGITQALVSYTAGKLGLALRKPRSPNKKMNEPITNTLDSIDARERALRAELMELQHKRANLVVQVNKTVDGAIVIHGLTEVPFETKAEYIRNFLDGQGPAKLRDTVGKKGM
jgi:hypothetical protein